MPRHRDGILAWCSLLDCIGGDIISCMGFSCLLRLGEDVVGNMHRQSLCSSVFCQGARQGWPIRVVESDVCVGWFTFKRWKLQDDG